MRVYISCHDRGPANDLADALTAAGHFVCSTWHRDPSPRPRNDDAKAWGDKASHNLMMIESADVLVVVASPDHVAGTRMVPGGKFFEAGYAYRTGKTVYTVGGVENGMLHLPPVGHAADVGELLAMLGR